MNIPQPANHLDHLIRQTRIHHIQLSSMADVKASMLLTLAALIITFSIGYLSDPYLRWPVVALSVFCLLTILTAAYAVMPKLDFRHQPNPKDPHCNILFFGNFMNMDYESFAEAMETVMSDHNRAYEAQVREVYEMGIYLGTKKYRYIRLSFVFFISGLLVSGLMLAGVELLALLS